MRPTLTMYRETIKRLAAKSSGFALDLDCPHCGYPEMSGTLDSNNEPLGVVVCRKCGHGEPRP